MGGAGGELPGSGALGGSKVIFESRAVLRFHSEAWRALRGPKKAPWAPCRARPRRRGNSTALVVLLPTVVDCTHVVGPIMFGWGAKHLSRFSGVSHAFLPVFDLILTTQRN